MTAGGPVERPSGTPLRLLGAVLAGGQSRRYGRDKASEVVAGVTLLDRAAGTLQEVCADVVIVSARHRPGPWPIVADRRGPCGPLGGIESALSHAAERHLDGVFVLACDLPLVRVDTVRSIVRRLADAPGELVAAPRGRGGRPVEPLCAAYRVECLEAARALLDAGSRAAVALFLRVGGVTLARPDGELLNVNTRDDRARAELALAERTHGAGVP